MQETPLAKGKAGNATWEPLQPSNGDLSCGSTEVVPSTPCPCGVRDLEDPGTGVSFELLLLLGLQFATGKDATGKISFRHFHHL